MKYPSLLLILLLPIAASAQTTDLTYWQDIRPVLRKHCIVCHSTAKVRQLEVSGGLALDTYAVAMKGSKQAVIHAGKSEKSLLYELLVTNDAKRRMPLESDPLSKEKISLIKKWIDAGAKEGTAPAEVAVVPIKKAATRKLDVVIPTVTTPPSGIPFGLKATGKLELAMKVGPLAPITALAFNHDNTLLATGSYGQVIVWDLTKGQPAKALTSVLGAVNDLKFSPKGDILAVGGGQPAGKGDLRLFQTSDWKLLATLRGHDDVVFSLSFNAKGDQLLSGSFDQSVRLWDVKTHAALKEFHNHSDFVYAVAFSPDGKRFASASKDRTVQLNDIETGKSVFTYSGMTEDVMAVAYHPDGKSVISSGFEAGIYWWNTQTGEKIKTQGGHGVATHEVAFSKDGKRAVSAGADRTVRTWDGATGLPVKVMPVGSIAYSVAISSSGKMIASGSFDGLVRLWDEASGRQLVTLHAIAEGDAAEWLAIAPEGYVNGSDKAITEARWRINGQNITTGPAWAMLRLPELVRQAFRGDALPPPLFEKK